MPLFVIGRNYKYADSKDELQAQHKAILVGQLFFILEINVASSEKFSEGRKNEATELLGLIAV